ncbi:MAG: tetratricopeptide repeat protein, partial [Candidatus Binatia bacterium]
NPAATHLYRRLLADGLSAPALDAGCVSVHYDRFQPRPPRHAGDLIHQSCEVHQALFARPDAAALYRRYVGQGLPWEPGNSAGTRDALRRFDEQVRRWRGELNLPGGVNVDLARRIFAWITDANGLGLRPVPDGTERSFDQTLQDGQGDCSELVRVLFTLLRRAGFSPYPVFVGRDEQGEPITHGVVGLDLGGQTYLLDLAHGNFNAPHQGFHRLSLREFLAWYWNNRANDLLRTEPALARDFYDRALAIDPGNPHFLTNRGLLSAGEGDAAAARADYLAALREAPRYAPAHFELGNLAFDAGRYGRAVPHYQRAVALWPGRSDFRRNLILALHHLGHDAAARRQLSELQARDPGHSDLESLLGS